MSSSYTSTATFESLFQSTSLDLLIPVHSSITQGHIEEWWRSVESAPTRDTAFLDEKLFYVVVLSVPALGSAENDEPPSEVLRFLARLQLSMSVEHLAPLTPPLPSAPPASTALQPPSPNPQAPADSEPHTPMPRPATSSEDERYAAQEGVVVWAGDVMLLDEVGREEGYEGGISRLVVKGNGGWYVVYKGQVPVVYVRTEIQDPVLSLTASVTLRDAPSRSKSVIAETSSVLSAGESVRTDATLGPDSFEVHENAMAGMGEIDLLGGLGEEAVPSSRLARSLRLDLSLPSHLPPTQTSSAITPSTAATPSLISSLSSGSRDRSARMTSTGLNTTLRKSYRRVLALSSGLRVRMRTLFLPQLLPPRSDVADDEEEDEGERHVALCVEIENPPDAHATTFEVESITVDVGGKGGKAQASLVCQPEQSTSGVFPLLLDPVEQYNLLYAVSISTTAEDPGASSSVEDTVARTIGKGDEQRPVAITVVGRPRAEDGSHPCQTFSSRWNCNLDLVAFYASQGGAAIPPPRTSMKPVPIAPNAIVGDKRFSYSTLSRPAYPPTQRVVSARSAAQRVPSSRTLVSDSHGLLVSVKVLDGESTAHKVVALQPFNLEVFIHNRTDEMRRFRLSIPPKEGSGRVRDVLAKRRKRRPDEPDWGQDDAVLRQLLVSYLASASAILPLEDDLRCGPLLPGASMAARVRFLALREGVHTLDQIRLTGANDEFDFIISPVLDIVVARE